MVNIPAIKPISCHVAAILAVPAPLIDRDHTLRGEQAMPQQDELAREAGALMRADLSGWAQVELPGTLIADISAALAGPLDEELRMARLAYCLVPPLAERCLVQLTGADGQLKAVALVAESQERAAELRGLWERLAPAWRGGTPSDERSANRRPLWSRRGFGSARPGFRETRPTPRSLRRSAAARPSWRPSSSRGGPWASSLSARPRPAAMTRATAP